LGSFPTFFFVLYPGAPDIKTKVPRSKRVSLLLAANSSKDKTVDRLRLINQPRKTKKAYEDSDKTNKQKSPQSLTNNPFCNMNS
jgi:hypothetical protein